MSMFNPLKDVVESQLLCDTYGDDIILLDELKESVVFRILREFRWGQQYYAVIQSKEQKKQDEFSIFRVERNVAGELELISLGDEDEWENVAEIYDEMAFPGDNP